ncbi:heme ABC transporter ATP-binding protein [Bacterioplanes sanyensis]|uniref:Heme ABC transporter ATP-binding protein n=1 Tax=Bacterioplanes sanyensis TaxID=1249553 RepID=A0A222FGY6_9GAMM|nr:heme ABC transporter ATP-binding protein [Bacterioplanes sanyensis]ASP38327.1 heme ABC transporter ATP-binding protein [Bacterioplanes sanyensis]
MITVNELSVFSRDKTLLKNIDFTLQPGQRLAVLGANGAGKSSLLKTLASERVLDEGQIWLDDQPLAEYPAQQRAKRIAVLPQQVELAFPFPVQQVVAMGRIPHGDEQHSQDLQRHAMQLMDVWHLRQRSYPSLSGGEQQRVQLARVLLQIWRPPTDAQGSELSRLLLLDECTSALDPAHQHAVMQQVKQFADHNVAVMAVLHDIALAASWADRVLLLKHGKIWAQGDVSLLAEPALLQQVYDLPGHLAQRYAEQNNAWLKAG